MDPVASEGKHHPVHHAALSLLETYQDILHDIYGNPEERPMVLTQANRQLFISSLKNFYEQLKAHGVPIAHSHKQPYGGEAARGAVEAMSIKLSGAALLLNIQRDDDPEYFSDLLSGLSVAAWISLVQDQAASAAPTPQPPREHDSVTIDSLTDMERDQVAVWLKAGEGQVLEVSKIARQARGAESPNRHDKAAARSLDEKGITEKVGRTGRRLIAIPKGMPIDRG
jgi:hypothetical protein